MTAAENTIEPNWMTVTKSTSWIPMRTASTSLVTRPMIRPILTRWKKLIGCRWVRAKISRRSPLTTVSPISRA